MDRSTSVRLVDNHNAPLTPGIRPERQQATPFSQIDQSIEHLASKKKEWAAISVRDRISILGAVTAAFLPVCDKWVQLSLADKGALQDNYASGWEWASGPMPILRYLRALKRTLNSIEKEGSPPLPSALVKRPNGQICVKIYPLDIYESLTTPGTTIEVWMEPGLTEEDVLSAQALPYFQSEPVGKLCLVLGAGNVSAGPFNDALWKLFVDNQVVVLKMNPVNDYLGPLIETTMDPLISRGYLQVVYGGASEGSYISSHPSIDCIHMMGSARTYEAITFGTGPEGHRRKRERQLICTKPFTAELGNLAPAIIVPGPWQEQDLEYQSQQLASHLCDSGSYSCSRTRVIVQHATWELRQPLLDGLLDALSSIPARVAYYPGAVELYKRFISAHPQAQSTGVEKEDTLPWTMISGIDPSNPKDICFTTESFCPVIAETGLEASSTSEFVDRAVDFVNDCIWGTLSASIIVHPLSLRDPEVSDAVERAIERLQYGVIAINCIPGLVWGLAVPPWGSYPGNPPWDIQSGSGFVHNAHMFSGTQKVVLRGPFLTWPLPPWLPSRSHRMAAICKRVAAYEAKPSIYRMIAIVASALL